ncbi:hypothetical protein [Pelagerythrobacter marensis]|uniref:Uncharacterized protein n=1 Tax=Pelagerythrobacter marensis TaxID=543877 RepID=A0A0G3X8L9_9SPHN|nr:hypothetical protein [Pelagerythrobacter marensis]AKM06703.1 hypothetical protein AM2010_618 [Pelagerythrobacter marensis]
MPATIRQWHRWISMAFVATVAAIFIVQALMTPPEWLYYTPLPFLFALILSGIYMWFRPARPGAAK